jgi:murein DD-endopeptidase MepM/ murein hydrolase activator NlpD
VTPESPAPLTRRQLRELEASGKLKPPVAVPKPTEVGFFAALPMAVEASVTELHVDDLVADEQVASHTVSVDASAADQTVTVAPTDDPFLTQLFAAPGSTVHPEAIPLVDDTVHGGRWVKRSRRDKAAAAAGRAPKSRSKVRRVKSPSAAKAARIAAASASAESAKPRGPRPASTLLSMGAMLFSAVLLVGTTVPANAFITFAADDPSSVVSTSTSSGEVQSVTVAADASIAEAARDSFSVTSYSQVLKQKYGTRVHTFAPTAGTIRWPFPYATPISSGFGSRVAPCRGCSSQHHGVDFTPGSGTPIYAIADGVVTEATFSGGFGQHVYLEHVINGKKVESYYAHMIGGSSPLSVGQTVKVGDLVGLVGSTGASTGAHLHLEIHLDGVVVDPFSWLEANAN